MASSFFNPQNTFSYAVVASVMALCALSMASKMASSSNSLID